jgi:hypothetical protein
VIVPVTYHTPAVEAVGVGEDRTRRSVEGAGGPSGGEREPEERECSQKAGRAIARPLDSS